MKFKLQQKWSSQLVEKRWWELINSSNNGKDLCLPILGDENVRETQQTHHFTECFAHVLMKVFWSVLRFWICYTGTCICCRRQLLLLLTSPFSDTCFVLIHSIRCTVLTTNIRKLDTVTIIWAMCVCTTNQIQDITLKSLASSKMNILGADLLQHLEQIHFFQYIFLIRGLWTVSEILDRQ